MLAVGTFLKNVRCADLVAVVRLPVIYFEEGDIAALSEKGHGGYLELDRVSEERTWIKGTRTTISGLLQGKVTQKILMKVP